MVLGILGGNKKKRKSITNRKVYRKVFRLTGELLDWHRLWFSTRQRARNDVRQVPDDAFGPCGGRRATTYRKM